MNSPVDEVTAPTFRSGLFVPMMATTIIHVRKAFELGIENSMDLFWRTLEARQHFFHRLECDLECHAGVMNAYSLLTEDKFKWDDADMQREYDVPSGGYRVQSASVTADFPPLCMRKLS